LTIIGIVVCEMVGGVVIMPVTGFSVTEQPERQTNPVIKAISRIRLGKASSLLNRDRDRGSA